jgi:ANTAR domain
MLSYRMQLPNSETVAGLNLYAEAADAFSDRDAMIRLLMATHGANTAGLMLYEREVKNLKIALGTNRHIGMAIRVLMATQRVSNDQAFDLLRIASHNSNRKLADVAYDVVETGTLNVQPPQSMGRASRRLDTRHPHSPCPRGALSDPIPAGSRTRRPVDHSPRYTGAIAERAGCPALPRHVGHAKVNCRTVNRRNARLPSG